MKEAMDEHFFPPFEGFPKEGMLFLKRLKKNNTRDWFHKHKPEYEEFVKFPMQCLIASLGEQMAREAPEIEFNPKRSIFRIHRDVRFSKNKAPYKTNIAASFEFRKNAKSPVETPGLYIGIEPGSIFIGGGLYMPSGDQIKAIRQSIVGRPEPFLEIVENKRFKKGLGGLQGKKLQKSPLGYPGDHPLIDHLKHKQFFVGKEYQDEAMCTKPGFLKVVTSVLTDTMPLVRWLAKTVG